MTKNRLRLLMVSIFFLLACGWLPPTPPVVEGWNCALPPASFREEDLVGTWENLFESGTSSDTLILRADGTYKQMIETFEGSYESPWHRWRLEYHSTGGLYLHLEHMRYCDSIDEICWLPEGGGGEGLYHDYCTGDVIEMHEEVSLVVIGTKNSNMFLEQAPKGIALQHMSSSEGTSWFILER